MDRRARLVEVVRGLETWGSGREWRGTDPYEGLNATRLVGPLRRYRRGRQLVIQAVKRSPLDLRRPLGIAPATNAAALAWVVSGYARDGFLAREEGERKLRAALRLLDELRAPGYEEPCWGYHFDFQSRVFFYERDDPNTIATAFAGIALLDAYRTLGDGRLLETAVAVGRFFLRHVPQTEAERGAFFGYLPDDRSPIHNSNALVCALLARLDATVDGGDTEFRRAAEAGIEYTLAGQRQDGSWPYGERANLQWIDNFHTGYVLDSLRACADAGIGGAVAEEAWRRGLDFYARELFLADGTPKYYPSSVFPIDAQCVAQGIQTFALAARHDRSFLERAWRVLDFALARMRRADGLFVFQRRRLWTNRLPHVRWVVAPTFLALAYLLEAEGAAERLVTGPRPADLGR